MKYKVKYRLDVNYFAVDYPDAVLSVSEPIYTLEEGLEKYEQATQLKCVDYEDKPARCWLWKYRYRKNGKGDYDLDPITIRKNYA